MEVQLEIKELLNKLGTSQISSSAYDTAWVAQLIELDEPLGAQALDWLRAHQLSNGCWGSEHVPYHHDRVVCTLAAMIALTRWGNQQDQRRVLRARLGLDIAIQSLQADISGATVGFEMIVPFLFDIAYDLGAITRKSDRDLTIAYPNMQKYDDVNLDGHRRNEIVLSQLTRGKNRKLARLPDGLIRREVTAAFSAEMVGQRGLNLLDVDCLQEENGSVGCSPSATAFFALHVRPGDPAALKYLRDVGRSNGLGLGGGMPQVTPFEVFEIAWSLWNLAWINPLNEELENLCQPHLDSLESTWKPGAGIGFASTYTPNDGDDTAVAFETLSSFGRAADVAALLCYEKDDHFRCYNLESNPSISVNIHMLGALRSAGFDAQHAAVQKIVKFLARTRILGSFWADKWHASPYYATTHAIIAGAGYVDELVENAVTWIIDTQNPNGSWGYYGPTAEETAYCLRAIFAWKQFGKELPSDSFRKGVAWLAAHADPPYESLWLSKCLYTPKLIVRSAVLSVLSLDTCL